MLSKELFREYLFNTCLFSGGNSILVGVSGGLDSVVLCDLLFKNKIDFAIAHVNYGLRAEESDGDEKFVSEMANYYKVPFYLLKCSEETFHESGENSIQSAARKIRYSFFQTCCNQQGYSTIATAHHKDDSIETALLNFARGTGIKGLTGISPVTDQLIRPLLFVSRNEIQNYAEENKLIWREDSSNETDKYSRNRFRHHLLPWLMKEIPQSYEGFESSFSKIRETELLVNASSQIWENACCVFVNENETKIGIAELIKFPQHELFFRNFLRRKGFPEFSAETIHRFLEGDSGITLLNSQVKIIRDREYIFLVYQNESCSDFSEFFSYSAENKPMEITSDKWTAFVDSDLLESPVEVRIWKEGDKLIPFGMKGHKNVSDILNELKLPLHIKQKSPVIISGNEIVWIPGYRIAEKFRITPKTTSVYRLIFNPEKYGR